MTALYMDTNVGCVETYRNWTVKDEGKKSLMDMVKRFFR